MSVAPPARAGTTGGITGRVLDAQTRLPVAGATVTAAAPSGSAKATTNAQGAYAILSLAPDTYVLTVEFAGYQTAVQPGVTVQADQTQTLALSVTKIIQTIGRTTSRALTDLVKPGTTSDTYSIGPAAAQAGAALGGPGGVDQAYSGLALVPGVYVPQGQQGWYQPIYIRGGDQDQIGYELDGIPANRSYDNAPMSLLSNIGTQELQVYTGGATASADGQGISGYINSVVKTGTNPSFANLNVGLGSPAGYQKAALEYGAVAGRLSFYVGAAAVDQHYRFYDQYNGVSKGQDGFFNPGSIYGVQYSANGGDLPGIAGAAARTRDRENVLNLHYSLPHASGNGKDDLQFLYLTQELWTDAYSSVNDLGGPQAFNGEPLYSDNYVYGGPVGAPLQNATRQYLFPNTSDSSRSFQSQISPDQRNIADNGYSVEKLQYQHNMGSNAYVRFATYGSYSNWFIHDPVATPFTLDYILPNHTFGYNALFADQVTDQHLLTVSGSITSTHESRYYPTGAFLGGDGQATSTNPTNGSYDALAGSYVDAKGNCYDASSGAHASCFSSGSQATYDAYTGQFVSGPFAAGYAGPPAGSAAAKAGAQWIATENGTSGNYNQVDPILYSYSVSDQWHPTDKLTINGGVRVEKYLDRFVNEADGYPTRQFWADAWNREYCSAPGLVGGPVDAGINPVTGAANACPAGTSPVAFSLAAPKSESNSVLEPRIGATYNLSPDSVVRASYGTYARPPNASWVQYGVTQEDLAGYAIPKFYSEYGFTTPVHDLRPDKSHNVDFSYEQHLRGTDLSFKLSPYYRGTMDQFENIFLNSNGAESGVNIGRERSFGLEAAFTKGSFARNGFAAQLSFTYDYSRFRYSKFASGNSVIDIINGNLKKYNAYTSYCGANPSSGICGATSNGAVAAPCYGSTGALSGAPVPCSTAGAVANPYYNAAPQPLFDPNAEYMPYDAIPDQPFLGGNGFGAPEVGTLLVNYKRNRFSITPSVTFSSGSDYGSPLAAEGADPVAGGGTIMVPDPYTGKFDNMGAFSQPWRLTTNVQFGYALTDRVHATLTLTGLTDNCVQRGYVWDRAGFCAYSTLPFGAPFSVNGGPTPNYLYPYTEQQGNNNTTFVGTKIPFKRI